MNHAPSRMLIHRMANDARNPVMELVFFLCAQQKFDFFLCEI